MTQPAIRTRQLVDWSSAIIAGLIAGAAFLAMNAFMVPAFLDADGSPAGFINAYGSILLSPAEDLRPPVPAALEPQAIPIPPAESAGIRTAGVGPGSNTLDSVPDESAAPKPAVDDSVAAVDPGPGGEATGAVAGTPDVRPTAARTVTDRDQAIIDFEEKNRFSWSTLFIVLGFNAVVTVFLSCLLAFIIHRGGLVTGAIGGALFGFVIYLAICTVVAWRAPVFAAAMKHWVFMATHISFGALSGLLYELLEVEEFVPIDDDASAGKAT